MTALLQGRSAAEMMTPAKDIMLSRSRKQNGNVVQFALHAVVACELGPVARCPPLLPLPPRCSLPPANTKGIAARWTSEGAQKQARVLFFQRR